MTRAYSNDLRERVAAAVASDRTCREVADLFGVSVARAVKWSQRQRQRGDCGIAADGRASQAVA
jgi:transposase